MPQAPKLRQLHFRDYPKAAEWIIGLLDDLNDRLGDLQFMNVQTSVLRDITIQTQAVVADTWPVTLYHDLPGSVRGISVVGLVNVTDGVAPTTAVWPIWVPASVGKGVVIQGITGLSASKVYKLTLRLES